MKLSVRERLLLLTLLPREGSYTNLKLVRQTRESLSFSDEENKALNFREEVIDGQNVFAWNQSAEVEKDIELGETVMGLIKKELERMDEAEKLSDDHIPIYEKFFSKKENEK